MPNWCENELVLTGAPADLAAFRRKAQGPNPFGEPALLTFHAFVPYPEGFLRLDKAHRAYGQVLAARKRILGRVLSEQEVAELKRELNPPAASGYASGGYEWCLQHWGTRWDAYEATLEEGEQKLIYRFNTAWSPPLPVVEAMARQHPALTLEFLYEEGLEGFEGYCRYVGGVAVEERSSD